MVTYAVDVLARSDAFQSLDQLELDRLASVCRVRRYAAGAPVFLRGDHGDSMFVVGSGAVGVSVGLEDGRDVLLAVLRPFQTFGELAVIDGGPRVATVMARDATVLVEVPGNAAATLLTRRPAVAVAMLNAMATLVRRLDEQACTASLLDLTSRVRKLLVDAVAPDARSGPDGYLPVDLPLTQADMARQVGGSRQRVNRVLMDMEATGSIRRTGHKVVGVRPDLVPASPRPRPDSPAAP